MPKKRFVIDRQKISLRNKKDETKATEYCLFEIRNKTIMNRPARLCEILLVKSSASKRSDQETLPQNEPVDNPDAGGYKDLFKTINPCKSTSDK